MGEPLGVSWTLIWVFLREVYNDKSSIWQFTFSDLRLSSLYLPSCFISCISVNQNTRLHKNLPWSLNDIGNTPFLILDSSTSYLHSPSVSRRRENMKNLKDSVHLNNGWVFDSFNYFLKNLRLPYFSLLKQNSQRRYKKSKSVGSNLPT